MRKGYIFFILIKLCVKLFAQDGVGIGIKNPSQDAILHLNSKNKGLLLPRYDIGIDENSNKIKNLFPNPGEEDDGIMYYNTLSSSLVYYQKITKNWLNLKSFPKGAIAIWSGNISQIPNGWYLCDGKNGTPDLRGRFIVGYGDGEYSTISNTGGKQINLLSVDELPKHSHEVIDPGHTHSASSTHNHNMNYTGYLSSPTDLKTTKGNGARNGINQFTTDEIKLSTAVVSISNSKAINEIQHTGGNQPVENRPNFYVVAFIMKK